MSHVVVYVFLLDNLAGLSLSNVLNETLIKNTPKSLSYLMPVVQQCDPDTTNQILNVVSKELDLDTFSTLRTDERDDLYNEPVIEEEAEFLAGTVDSFDNDAIQKYRRTFGYGNKYNIKNILAKNVHKGNKNYIAEEDEHRDKINNLTEQDKHNKNTNKLSEQHKHEETSNNLNGKDNHGENCNNFTGEDKLRENAMNFSHGEEHKQSTTNYIIEDNHDEDAHHSIEGNEHKENVSNVTKDSKQENATTVVVDLPTSAPFLVAIFETLSNVTAQTCAGTLIDPIWVLTGANCVNILSNLYENDTNKTATQTLYTVVAGAIDPLSDGSAHNVTAVLQHHRFSDNNSRNRKSVHVEIGPYLAMMKIEPKFEGARLLMVEDKVTKGDVMIYGWVLSKNTLNLVIISALILSSAECQAMYSYNNKDIICLYNNEKDVNITQLSSGGPVLMLQDGQVKLLAVAQTDEYVFIAYPLYVHYNWIQNILNNKM